MRISIPAVIDLTCPGCKGEFSLRSALLNGRRDVRCPICAQSVSVYDALAPKLRRQIYHAVRDQLEKRIYDEQQMNNPSYFEDRANLLSPVEDDDDNTDSNG